MRQTVLGAVFALCACAVLSAGCVSNAPSSPNSFTKVYTEVIQPKCSNNFCHYNGVDIRFGALDLSSRVRAYWSLVDMPCMGPCGSTGTRVVPGQPDASVMYLKLLDQDQLPAGTSRCGSQMPADSTNYSTNLGDPSTLVQTSTVTFSGPSLPANQLQLIRDWIQEGALYN
jgi:hypothetical protein